jgi:NADPH-dependent curcumin reductase
VPPIGLAGNLSGAKSLKNMTQNKTTNRRIVLASRPTGAPKKANFRLEEVAIPNAEKVQLLLRTVYPSVDPYMRGRMSDAPSYAAPVAIDGVMEGGTVSRVEVSNIPDFQSGDLVVSHNGWQDYTVSDGSGHEVLAPEFLHAVAQSIADAGAILITGPLERQYRAEGAH